MTFELLNNNTVESNQIDEDVLYQKSMSFSAHLEGFNNLNAQNESVIMKNDSSKEKNLYIEKDDELIKSTPSLTNSSVTVINSSILTQTPNSHFDAINSG